MRLSLFEHRDSYKSTVAVLVLFLNSIHRCRDFEMEVKTLGGRHPDYSRIDTQELTVLLQSVSVRIDGSLATYRPFIMTRLLSSPNLRFVQWHHNRQLPLTVAAHFWSELRELRFETEVNLVCAVLLSMSRTTSGVQNRHFATEMEISTGYFTTAHTPLGIVSSDGPL